MAKSWTVWQYVSILTRMCELEVPKDSITPPALGCVCMLSPLRGLVFLKSPSSLTLRRWSSQTSSHTLTHLSNVHSSQTWKEFATGKKVGALILNSSGFKHFMVYLQENIERIWTEYSFQNDWIFASHNNTPISDSNLTSKEACNTYTATKNIFNRITFNRIPDVLTESAFTGTRKTQSLILTANHHHSHSKDLLPIRGRSDVPEPDTGEAGHGKIERGDVDGILAGPALPLPEPGGVEAVGGAYGLPQLVEPALGADGVGVLVDDLVVADAVPDAGQPVRGQPEHTHQQHQHGRPVLDVVVQLPSHAAQPQQPHHFERAEEAADALQGWSTGGKLEFRAGSKSIRNCGLQWPFPRVNICTLAFIHNHFMRCSLNSLFRLFEQVYKHLCKNFNQQAVCCISSREFLCNTSDVMSHL